MTIEQAQAYLRENTYGKLRAVIRDPYYGERNATICNGNSCVIVLKPRSKRHGYRLDWDWVQKIWHEVIEPKNMTAKFTDKAKKATFTNPFIRKCLNACPTKSPYENGLSTGVPIEGQIITLKSIEKQYPYIVSQFRRALKERRPYNSLSRPKFRGYDMTLSLWWADEEKTELSGGLSLERKDCGNGYYYLLINDDEFIGYDID